MKALRGLPAVTRLTIYRRPRVLYFNVLEEILYFKVYTEECNHYTGPSAHESVESPLAALSSVAVVAGDHLLAGSFVFVACPDV